VHEGRRRGLRHACRPVPQRVRQPSQGVGGRRRLLDLLHTLTMTSEDGCQAAIEDEPTGAIAGNSGGVAAAVSALEKEPCGKVAEAPPPVKKRRRVGWGAPAPTPAVATPAHTAAPAPPAPDRVPVDGTRLYVSSLGALQDEQLRVAFGAFGAIEVCTSVAAAAVVLLAAVSSSMLVHCPWPCLFACSCAHPSRKL
jgi:hypothetical protein